MNVTLVIVNNSAEGWKYAGIFYGKMHLFFFFNMPNISLCICWKLSYISFLSQNLLMLSSML